MLYLNILYQNVNDQSIVNQNLIRRVFFLLWRGMAKAYIVNLTVHSNDRASAVHSMIRTCAHAIRRFENRARSKPLTITFIFNLPNEPKI